MDDGLTALALAARTGEPGALAGFVRASQRDVWRLSAHLVDAATAADLTQETYLRVVKALPGFRGESSARTWLLSIARRVAADELRSRTRRRALHERAEALPRGRPEPDTAEHSVVRDLLARLDPERREALVLTQVTGLSYDEAARVCGCPVGTIRSRVFRARQDLVDMLEAAPTRAHG